MYAAARALIVLAAGFAAGAAFAGSPLKQAFQVSADIVTGCSVTQGGNGRWGNIDFGSVSGIAGGTVSAGLISSAGSGLQISCTPGTTISVTADTGLNASGGTRRLGIAGDASARVPYQLYANGSQTAWTNQAISIAFPRGTSVATLPIAGIATLPGSQRAGAYADTVTITLNW